MLILSIDSSCQTAQTALIRDGMVLCEFAVRDNRTLSVKLMPAIQMLFSYSGTALPEVDLIAAVNGPGSFTGLRIGVAAAKAIAFARQIPVVGINTLDALAHCAGGRGLTCAVIDARNAQVSCGIYRDGLRISDYMAVSAAELCLYLKRQYPEEPVVFCGDGVPANREIFCKMLDGQYQEVPSELLLGRASSAGVLAEQAFRTAQKNGAEGVYDAFSLEVSYLRKSQAERLKEEAHGHSL